MARARIRKNPQRRRRDYQKKKLLQGLCASVDQQDAQADSTGDGPETASTADQKTPSPEPKQRSKPRKVPDRHYYDRPGKMERQYLGLQRQVTSTVDDKIAEGSATLRKWKRDASDFMGKFKRKGEEEREELRRDLSRLRESHNLRLRINLDQITRLQRNFGELRKQFTELKYEGKGTG